MENSWAKTVADSHLGNVFLSRMAGAESAAQAQKLQSLDLPLGGACDLCPLGHCLRQVFGLAGCLLAPAFQSFAEPVPCSGLSFLLTAAGQFRMHAGFPFKVSE